MKKVILHVLWMFKYKYQKFISYNYITLVRSIVVLRRVELSDNPAYSCVRDEHTNNHFTNRVYENVS